MQQFIGSSNIEYFGFNVNVNIAERKFVFDLAGLTTFTGSGATNVLGICFSVVDQGGLPLLEYNWTSPQIPPPIAADDTYELDLTAWWYDFMFQKYSIKGAIKDQDGEIYELIFPIKEVCKPTKFTDAGYAEATFIVQAQCNTKTITVKDATVYTYQKVEATSITKDGSLFYPQGTISPVEFSGTPFRNPKLYTGLYTIQCTSDAVYDLGDGFYVTVQYYVRGDKTIYCGKSVATVFCCIQEIQARAKANCGNPVGLAAQQQLLEISVPLMQACVGETIGVDVSDQVELIKNTLKCNCGRGETLQVEQETEDLSITSIVIEGAGGTSVDNGVVNGNTKTYTVTSNTYVVQKGNVNDLAFSITTDTNTTNVVKYIITFDYAKIANYIYTATANDDTLLTQFNSLVWPMGIDLSNINGKCIIDLSENNYFLSLRVASYATLVKNIIVGSTTYVAPANLLVSNVPGVNAWLNGLLVGSFESSFSTNPLTGAYINVLSVANPFTVVSMTFTNSAGDTTIDFQKTTKSIIALLQAMIDYLCEITAANVYLGRTLEFCYYDYNGELVTASLLGGQTQDTYNQYIAVALCGISNKIASLTALTCAKIQAVFGEYPNAVMDGTSRILSIVDGNCTASTTKQVALGVIAAINANTDVKTAFCAIDCTAPGTCPDVAETSLAMSGNNIGLYGLTWTSNPVSSQTVTVKYRINGDTTWLVSTNSLLIFPNGTISGSVPYVVYEGTPGVTYDVQVINNCGGVGFIKQVTVPSDTVYSDSFLVDSVLYTLCGEEPVTLYSSAPFGPGVTMYTDSGLTTLATGYLYIANANNGIIFEIDNSTAVVGEETGNVCDSGVSGSYRLGNNSGTVCDASLTTLYTDGIFAVGKILYIDSGLTTPQTGYSYVVNVADDTIYNLNSVSGVVGASTGVTCGSEPVTANMLSLPASAMCDPCGAGSTPINMYTDPSEPTPTISMVTYSNSGLTIPFAGDSKWYKLVWNGSTPTSINLLQINNSGVVIDSGQCSVDCP